MLETRRDERDRERGQEGFIRRGVRARCAQATSFRENANTEVRTMPQLPSAYLVYATDGTSIRKLVSSLTLD